MENGFGSENSRGVNTSGAAGAEAVMGVWSRRDELGKHSGELPVRVLGWQATETSYG